MNNYEILSDRQLIENLRNGDCNIMDFIMEKYKNIVKKKAKAMYLLGGENDDLIQEGMIGLFKAVQDYKNDEEASFHTFADLCISRQIYSAIEASQRKKHIPLNSYISIYSDNGEYTNSDLRDAMNDTQGNPESLLLGQEYHEGLEHELRKELSELENRVLYLYIRGEDYKTIAKLLGKSPKAIDNALQRIKGKASIILKRI